MITIEQARKKLSKKYEEYSDEQIQRILDFFYTIAYSVINSENN